ncbi:tetratricopeptide repeat protein [Obesumbacterium proteus]|uniref:TadD family pilus assembly protein n=1 Tax=Obesumbacterium proteus ATCC 12841 TaxID=1354268 RepID=A0AA91EHV0_9GAMM|nr:tetratricopeptide repeat protein [Obesumbacterium proteus]KKI47871.1 tight adherance operon protein [Obesumbacterium proteus]OAT60853.1 TadD family pilus assembly protein [Obesumbacterium proteus ATCC 12841]
MRISKKITMGLLCVALLSGCVQRTPTSTSDMNYQEDILLKAKNYNGLINLYRSWLKKKEDPAARLKLARYYYQSGDYKSSIYFMQPLFKTPDLNVYTLQAQNMIALGDYPQAIRVTEKMLQREPQSAEAYNLKGIALAQSGKLTEGYAAIEKSRSLFIADDVAINNMAMIAILDHRYQDAVSLLLPQYLRGRKQSQLLHNLVLSLVKVGDRRYARDIIQNESLSEKSDELIDALAMINPAEKGIG